MSAGADHWQALAALADPLADRTVAAIVGQAGVSDAGLARLAQATRLMAGWTTNAGLAGWTAPEGTDPDLAAALRGYLEGGRHLPAWARPKDIETAEAVFMDYGPMSCTLLFCASLPECYVLRH
ncbi:MAG TPA: DUF2236 domain-containing protein, partial [Ramlibacter sp.]|nr:DUF2236 domain-containing protein [Ramlibacter sp.]